MSSTESNMMTVNLEIWRQDSKDLPGQFVAYKAKEITPDMSFLEMLDLLNEQLILEGQLPVQFDSDCREGICGSCGIVINGQAHGPKLGVASCQLMMRDFQDNALIVVEPWRAKAFSVIRDLVVDRTALDRIITAGGYTSAKSGPHPDANSILIGKDVADRAMDAAACIGCGACVAACPNASASLFTAAKIAHLSLMPQGQVERDRRARRMVAQMDLEGFGNCTNIGECRSACPKEISIDHIARMRREYIRASSG